MAKKILIIDDDPKIAQLYATFLRKSGYEVISASGAEEGLTKLSRDWVNLVILDIDMPGLNGLQALERIRTDPRHSDVSDVPVIMVTASDSGDHYIESSMLGALSYLTKPVRSAKLVETVKTLIG